MKDLQKKVEISARFGETLVKMQDAGSSCSIFNDPEFGEFSCNFYNFIKGKCCHPRRRKKIGKRMTKIEAETKLKEKGIDIKIKDYGGAATYNSIFVDPEFGEFEATLHSILRGKKHPDRLFNERSVRSKKMFQDPEHLLKWKKGLKKFDRQAASLKRKKRMKEKWGVEHALQHEKFCEKLKKTNVERYGKEHFAQSSIGKEKIRSKKIANGSIKLFKGKSVSEHAKELGKAYSTFISQVNKYGFEQALQITKRHSFQESLLRNFLEEANLKFTPQFEVSGKLADFRVEDNLLVELNGLFWHGEMIIANKNHHKERLNLFKQAGFNCLFFREDEVLQKFEIVKSIILNKIGKNKKRFFARKCKIEIIQDKKISKHFFTENHLMGNGSGVAFALFFNGQIVSMMQIKKNKDSIEISRFCNRINTSVVGGFSKLLKFAEQYFETSKVITFIDKRYGEGSYLNSLGFRKMTDSLSFRWTNGKETFHRLKFRRNTGYDYNYFKIWDCGQAKYMKVSN